MAGEIDARDIQDHVRGYAEKGLISRWSVPDRVLFVDVIEKTSVGKVDKKLLRQKYQVEFGV